MKQLGDDIPENKAKTVYNQLLPDFPPTAIAWVNRARWEGPEEVSIDDIDFSNRANWTADREPQKVNEHVKLIKEGVSKPVILVRLPKHDKLFVADAHHRLLAYEKVGHNPICYIGTISPSDIEAAMTMHSKQFSGKSRLDGA